MHSFSVFKNEPDIRAFTAGQQICSEGDAGDALMFAVLEGEVDIVRDDRLLETIQPMGVFGELALRDQLPRAPRRSRRRTAGSQQSATAGWCGWSRRTPVWRWT
jgi:CRP-like cAMP-binding protein